MALLLLVACADVPVGRFGSGSDASVDLDGSVSAQDGGMARDGAADGATADGATVDAGRDAAAIDADCVVGTAAYPTVQSALEDPSCLTIYVPAGTWSEHLAVDRTVTVFGDGTDATILSGGGTGRALAIGAGGEVTLKELSVRDGRAAVGAGIDLSGTLTLERASVEANVASGGDAAGAGIAIHGGELVLADGARVSGNRAEGTTRAAGGGLFVEGAALVRIAGAARIEGNSATATAGPTLGGGVAVDRGAILRSEGGVLTVRANAVRANASSGLGAGGGIHCGEGTLDLEGAIVDANTVDAPGDRADARGGGLALDRCTTALTDVTIATNRVDTDAIGSGGGVDVRDSAFAIARSRLRANVLAHEHLGDAARIAEVGGGGLSVRGGDGTVFTSQLDGNRVVASGGLLTGPSAWGGGVAVSHPELGTTRLVIEASTVGPANEVRAASTGAVATRALGGGVGLFDQSGTDDASVFVVNGTISGNLAAATGTGGASFGGGVGLLRSDASAVALSLIHSTVALNQAASGGGLGARSTPTGSLVTLQNSILATNTGGDCSLQGTTFDAVGTGILGDATGCPGATAAMLVGVDPALSSLADAGGPTPTLAIGVGSPAHDAGLASGCLHVDGSPLGTDQRLNVRAGACDLGSFEVR